MPILSEILSHLFISSEPLFNFAMSGQDGTPKCRFAGGCFHGFTCRDAPSPMLVPNPLSVTVILTVN